MKKFDSIKEIIDLVWDVYSDESNSVADLNYLLNGFVDELKTDSKGVLNAVEAKIEEIRGWGIKHEVCPECGGALEFEHNPDYDTYVPYGEGMVLESEGGCLVCHDCGFRTED